MAWENILLGKLGDWFICMMTQFQNILRIFPHQPLLLYGAKDNILIDWRLIQY